MTKPIFWTNIAERYAARPVSDPNAYAHTLERTTEHLNPTDTVLEIGCGTGTTALKLAPSVTQYLATDYAEGMIEIARAKPAADTLRFEIADDQMTALKADEFDVALAFNLLHLLPDLESTLARVSTVLKPGGHFISKTPCIAGNPFFAVVIAALRLVGRAPYVAMLRPAQLKDKIRQAGFEIVEVADHNKGNRGHFIVARKPV